MAIRSAAVIRLSSSVRLVQPEAAQALEQAWQQRRRELASWQPSGGWLLDPRIIKRLQPTPLLPLAGEG